jgi:hypothetical protein
MTVERTVTRKRGALAEGILVGLAGALVVAAWFLVFDALHGAPFRTPSLLGAALFDRVAHANSVSPSLSLVSRYTLVHGAAFIVFGCALVGLFNIADREPRFLFAIFMLLCCFQVAFVCVAFITAEWLLDPVPWPAILVGNLLATVAMLAVLLPHHRPAWRPYARAWARDSRERDPLDA